MMLIGHPVLQKKVLTRNVLTLDTFPLPKFNFQSYQNFKASTSIPRGAEHAGNAGGEGGTGPHCPYLLLSVSTSLCLHCLPVHLGLSIAKSWRHELAFWVDRHISFKNLQCLYGNLMANYFL